MDTLYHFTSHSLCSVFPLHCSSHLAFTYTRVILSQLHVSVRRVVRRCISMHTTLVSTHVSWFHVMWTHCNTLQVTPYVVFFRSTAAHTLHSRTYTRDDILSQLHVSVHRLVRRFRSMVQTLIPMYLAGYVFCGHTVPLYKSLPM